MVNELQSQEWAYLLDPCFQLANTKGAPLTGGYLEVFYHGTRTPYYCASDFNGTLHPFKIPLDSLGSNVVLADPNFSYDVYVYNKYGVLQMSRYDVNPGLGGSGGISGEGGDAAHWIGKSASSVSVPKLTATTLPIPENPDYEGDFATILNNTFTLAPGLYMVDCLVDFRQSSSDLTNKMGSIKFYTSDSSDPIEGQIFERNETGPDASGDSHQVQVSFVRHVAEVDDDDALRFEMTSTNDLTYARIDRLSIVKLEQGGGGTAYAAGYGIQIDGQVISTSGMMPESSAANFVDNSTYQVDIQNIYETIAETSAMIPSGVATEQWVVDQGYITSADLPQSVPLVAGEGISIVDNPDSTIISLDSAYGVATQEWIEDQHYLTSGDIPEPVTYTAGSHIDITNNEISVTGVSGLLAGENITITTSGGNYYINSTGGSVPEDVVTSGELATVSGDIVSQIPSLDGYATEEWVGEQGYLTSIPEDLVTSAELSTVSGEIVNQIPSYTAGDNISIENDVISVDDTAGLIAGDNINITASGDNYVISSIGGELPADLVTSGQLATVSAQIENDIPDVSDMATQTWVNEQGFLTSLPEDLVTSAELAAVSGYIMNEIPDTSDMATKTWVGEQGYLTSVPAEYATSGDLVTLSGAIEAEIPSYTAGDNISIVNDEISVSGTAGLIAGENISLTASGDNYVISYTGGEVPADVVTYGELATVSGEIMSQMPSQTTVSIDPTLSSGTKIAEFNINGTSGELFAPNGGYGDSIDLLNNNILVETADDKTWIFNTAGEINDQGWQATALVAATNGSFYARIYRPWNYKHNNTSNLIYISLPSYITEDYHLAWFPTTNKTRYLRFKQFLRYGYNNYFLYDSNGRRDVSSYYYQYAIELPKSTGLDFDTDKFDVVGDWSGITTPIETWLIGFIDANGNMTAPGLTYNDTTTEWSLRGTRPAVKLKSGGGINRDYWNGLYVDNPLPSSTVANNDQILTVVNGSPTWVTPSGSGGSVTFPLEVSGSTNVYEARDGLTSGYVNAGEIYVGYHDDGGGGEPDIDTVSITPYMVQVKADWGGISPTMTEVAPGVVTLYDNEGGSQYVDFNKVEYWDDTCNYVDSSAAYWNWAYKATSTSAAYWNTAYNAVNDSATYWNSSIFSDQITSAALVNSLPADASAHPNYLYLIPET